MNAEQHRNMGTGRGFIAALDQSGGSTPKALGLYGIPESAYQTEEEMFDLVHQMRVRIMTNPAFDGNRILGAILFEMTMDREVQGLPTAQFLWENKGVTPFLKVDKGLAAEADGVQLMKEIPDLDSLLERAVQKGIFGTKMRSVIATANESGIRQIVDQQFELAHQILGHGLVPIIEPEVDIHSETKAQCEQLLRTAILQKLDDVPEGSQIMLKLSLPTEDNFYADLINHPKVLRVVALSGGYDRVEADVLLARNHGLIASFSRALSEGLRADQTDAEFTAMLDDSIQQIYDASIT